MRLAFFRVLIACVCVCVCRGRDHHLVGASCLPSGSKVCAFPTNLQAHSQIGDNAEHSLLVWG